MWTTLRKKVLNKSNFRVFLLFTVLCFCFYSPGITFNDGVFLIEDIPLCFNTYNKTNSLFRQEHNNSI